MALCHRAYNKQIPKHWILTQWESGSESKNKVVARVSWPFLYAQGKLELYPSVRTELCLFISKNSERDYSVLAFHIYSLSTGLSPGAT